MKSIKFTGRCSSPGVSNRRPVRWVAAAIGAIVSSIVAAPVQATTTSAPLNPIVRTVTYDYEVGTARLKKEVVEGATPDLCKVTAYDLDTYGHPTLVTTRNCNGSAATYPGAAAEGGAPATGALSVFATRKIAYTYSSDQRFVSTTTTDPITTKSDTTTFDARFGMPTGGTDVNGIVTGAAYDAFGRKSLERRADGTGMKYAYDWCSGAGGTASCPSVSPVAAAYTITVTPVAAPIDLSAMSSGAPIGPYIRTYYDALGREIRSESPGFDVGGTSKLIYVDTVYDGYNRVAQKSRPYYAGDTPSFVNYFYDSLSRVTKTIESDAGGTVTLGTSYQGATTVTTNGLNKKTTQVRNAMGTVVRVINANGDAFTTTYDGAGDVVQTQDALGNTTSLIYDVLGRRTELHDPDLGNQIFTYDAAGQLVQLQDNKGQTSRTSFDALGRPTKRIENDLTTNWIYDRGDAACGYVRLCEETATNGFDRSTSYDAAGRIVSLTTTMDTTFTSGVSYDAATGRVDKVSYPSGLVVQYGYTAGGYLKTVTDLHANAAIWTATAFDAAGRPTRYGYGAGAGGTVVSLADTYYDDGRLKTSQATGYAGSTLQNLTYAYDLAGNTSARVDVATGVSSSYAYDAINRLTSETRSGGSLTSNQSLGYAYDAIGNLTLRRENGVDATYAYSPSGLGSSLPHAVS